MCDWWGGSLSGHLWTPPAPHISFSFLLSPLLLPTLLQECQVCRFPRDLEQPAGWKQSWQLFTKGLRPMRSWGTALPVRPLSALVPPLSHTLSHVPASFSSWHFSPPHHLLHLCIKLIVHRFIRMSAPQVKDFCCDHCSVPHARKRARAVRAGRVTWMKISLPKDSSHFRAPRAPSHYLRSTGLHA